MLATGEVKCIDDEIPFDLPYSWVWARIRDISQSYIGLTYSPANVVNRGGTIVLRSSNIKSGKLDLHDIVRVDKPIVEKLKVERNDIIICARNGSKRLVGKSALVTDVPEAMTFGAFMAICKTQLYNYVYLFLQSDLFFGQLREVSGTTTINQLTQYNFNSFLIPIPPFDEQTRIVERYTVLSPFIDRYGVAQTKLYELNGTIHQSLKKSILQQAIQGLLVEQNPDDEPASVLLDKIKDEKERLIKEKKIKRDKQESIIYRGDDNKYWEKRGKEIRCIEDDIPFEIPDTWCWVRGRFAFLPMESTKPQGEEFVYIDVAAVNNITNVIDGAKVIQSKDAPSRATRKLHLYDILFSMVRPYLRNIALVTKEYSNAIASTGYYVISPSVGYNPQFLLLLMLSPYVVDGLNQYMKGDNSPSVNNADIENFLYPLPPLKEQQRIVDVVMAAWQVL